MKRVFLMVAMLLMVVGSVCAQSVKSQTIVFISGQKFYVHNVAEGETLYSLSKLYGVSQNDILDNNSSVKEKGLQLAENIKVPFKEGRPQRVTLDRKSRKNFDVHTVESGETLYAISREHEISVATIIEDNPSIDPSNLAVNQQILIRKKERGKTSEAETITELTEYKENLNRVAPEGYEYHLVEPQETLYSLLLNTQMSRKEFFEVNNSMASDELKACDIVLVRIQKEELTLSEDDEDKEDYNIKFKALRGSDTLYVSLLLPLTSSSGAVAPIFEEFYKGFLLGVEELKESGRNVSVSLFDTKRSLNEVSQIVEEDNFRRSKLIVGPVYEELLAEVVAYAQKRSIPVVSPLATLQRNSSGVLFQMAPIADHRYDKIGDLIADSVAVTLIYTENTDLQYEAEVKAMLGDKPYKTHKYEYVHPSIIAKKSIVGKTSPGDLSPFIHGSSPATFFIMSDNETDVDRVLSAFASAQIGLQSRSLRVCDFAIVNNSKWNRYSNIDRAMFFRNNVTAFTSYHAKRDGDVIKSFDSRYAKAFGALPSLYSYRGYDVAKIFGRGLYSDIEYGMEGRTFTPLQTTYRFQKMMGNENRANQNWIRVNYKNNFTITVE